MTMDMDAAGSLAVAGLVATQIEGEGGKLGQAHGKDGHHPGRCLNCDTALTGAYCHVCGQSGHVHKSLLHLGEEVLHGLLHFDAKGLRTLPMLVLHPGQLTRRYIDGQRTRYVSPLALFLFMVFLMFFVASFTGGKKSDFDFAKSLPGIAAARTEMANDRRDALTELAAAQAVLDKPGADPADVREATRELKQAQAEIARLDKAMQAVDAGTDSITSDGSKLSEKLKTKGIKANTGWPAADEALRHAADNPALTIYKLKSTGSKLSFLLVPISLPFLWLLFCWKRGVTMYDHAVFSLYSLSFMSLLFVVVFLLSFAGLSGVLPWLICLAPPIHMFVQLRGTYGLRRRSALWRTFALLCISATVFVTYLLIILVMSVR